VSLGDEAHRLLSEVAPELLEEVKDAQTAVSIQTKCPWTYESLNMQRGQKALTSNRILSVDALVVVTFLGAKVSDSSSLQLEVLSHIMDLSGPLSLRAAVLKPLM